MTNRYYTDTSIWIDLYEDRKGFNNEKLGDHALDLFYFIIDKNHKLIISDILIEELGRYYSVAEINGMMKIYESLIEKVSVSEKQHKEADKIVKEKKLPLGDVLHALLARDHKLILVTRDKHFKELKYISKQYKPEELI
jgi:predicted nucleic acid-binding protein